ncbi:MAPEG family protein [Mesorhizobium sp. VK4C]|uniref:MAPEG family protein n=1 Tax=Mesorhizobium captivum TaxID=3072319 RepID=UPI002A242F06|nr:MAPEG family protein [Mesorhizobium sp. VK4C]MDX8499796.1 MAPEG family protein [Mesorhizobium sp. VK4C]
MNQTAIFWPMLAHVLLVYIVYLVMFKRRFLAVKSGEAKISQYKVRSTEPASSVTVANNLINQFELPVLFHVLCLALFVTNGVNYLTLALMWLFVVTRYIHAWVHLTRNYLLHRSRAFFLGAGILLIAWIWFALHLAGAV